jgi:hypothetical protein
VLNAGLSASHADNHKSFMKTSVREETFAMIGEVLDVFLPLTLRNIIKSNSMIERFLQPGYIFYSANLVINFALVVEFFLGYIHSKQ